MPKNNSVRALAGTTVRCYGNNAPGCGWVGDSGEVRVIPFGPHVCPKCGGGTVPPPRGKMR